MKFITYQDVRGPRLAALLDGECALDLADAAAAGAAAVGTAAAGAATQRGTPAAHFESMLALLRGGDAALDEARRLVAAAGADTAGCVPLAGLPLCAPLPLPEQIRDFANYELHVRQALASSMKLRAQAEADPAAALQRLGASGMFAIPPVWYERPLYYKANRFSVVGPDADVEWPAFSNRLDYELELAVVIGRRVRDVSESQAMDAVFGYTIYNDFSARDTQGQESSFRMGPAKSKDFDTGNSIGPCIVTRDEIEDPDSLRMSVRVNGELRVETLSGGMQHSIARCISFLSQSETLYPGEILAMGTVGNGCGYESLNFLADGDVVELEVQGIGRLRNRVVKRKKE